MVNYTYTPSVAQQRNKWNIIRSHRWLTSLLWLYYTGTNSLRGESTPEEVADEVIDLATNFKTDHNEIVISEIIASRDQVNEKAVRVNNFLRLKTTELGIGYISHENINTDMHLNPKGLHLNHKGSILLSRNFINLVTA